MVLRSVPPPLPPPPIDSGNWLLQGSGMQESGFQSGAESMVGCGRSMMERRLKPNGSEVALKCPRCDSPNTKFCYYNNYSLTQPRYFCKTCRRYWTKGGTLRNVPVGGGCRKNKRFKRAGDQPSQTSDASASASASASFHNTNELNCTSSPIPEHSNLNLPPPVRSVYFTLLNGGADGLGISYSSAGGGTGDQEQEEEQHHNLGALKVAAGADLHRIRESESSNSNRNGRGRGRSVMMMMEVPSTSNSTASHEALGNMSNLNTFQSPPNLIPEQAPSLVQINGDLSTIFEAGRHHHQNQQVPTSAAPTFPHVSTNSNRFNDVTGVVVNDHRLNSGLQDQDVQIQWHHHHHQHDNGGPHGTAAQVLLPFDHETHNQVRAAHDDEMKLRHLIMDGIHTTPLPGGELIEQNGHPHDVTPYNWHLPRSEGLLDTSANNINYWNASAAAAGAWPDLSSYAPYTNPLI